MALRRGLARPGLLRAIGGKTIRRLTGRLRPLVVPVQERVTPRFDLLNVVDSSRRGVYYFSASSAASLVDARSPATGDFEEALKHADAAVAHVFDLLGSGPVDLGARIDWHSDFKVGVSWPSRSVLSIGDLTSRGGGADIKVPWELSRFQHAFALGGAYLLTGDGAYVREFVSQVTDWIDRNPWGRGPNWGCAMDVAIRAANWILGYHLLESAAEFGESAREKIIASLWAHGWFIERNLERGAINGNHYLSDLAGLFALGVFFAGEPRGSRWMSFAFAEMCREMRLQVLDDGVDYEKSVSYHRLVLELFTYTFILAERNGFVLPADIRERWERMFDFVAAYTRPDGLAPQIGDTDDGVLYKLSASTSFARETLIARGGSDHRYLLCLGAIMFNRPDLASAAGGFHDEALWVLGSDARSRFAACRETGSDHDHARLSAAFASGGFYVICSGGHYAIIDAGDNGHGGLGGHSHCDTLSFELCAFGVPFIVDPGTFVYTADAEARNDFRSTESHNTLQIDGEQIHPIRPNRLFYLPDAGEVRVTEWRCDDAGVVLGAEHDCYSRLCEGVIVRRKIVFENAVPRWKITDEFVGPGEHEAVLRLHLAPEVELHPKGLGAYEAVSGGVCLLIETECEETCADAVEQSRFSPGYGVKVSSKTLVYRWRGAAPGRFALTLTARERER